MADVLRPAVRQAVAPISETAGQITISDSKLSSRVSLDGADKEAIMSEAPVEVGKEEVYQVKFTEMDMENGSCKVELAEHGQKRIPGKITDPEFILANNAYVAAMARKEFIRVRAKPTFKEGEINRLFISNLVPPSGE